MSTALTALKKMQTTLSSVLLGSGMEEKKRYHTATTSHGWLEPGPLARLTKTGGCRLPTLEAITSACKACQYDEGRHEVDASTSEKLAADLARPFGQSTGRGFSFTRFRLDRGYRTLTMRQQDVWTPWMAPDHTATLRTLYEIGCILTYADPICQHL